jgi:signal transduction histidine kinase
MSGTKFLYGIIGPRSEDEDSKRREFILNVLLLGAMIFSVIANIFLLYDVFTQPIGARSSAVVPLFFLLVVLSLYILSRIGFYTVSSYILIGLLYVSGTYCFYMWGSDIPEGLLIYAMIIVMSGILINTRFAFAVTLIASSTLILTSQLQSSLRVPPAVAYWRNTPLRIGNLVVYAVIFAIIMLVSWLSNREIERSLARARSSESALQKERDNLEKMVEERTKELEKAQKEKMLQLYKFAEFGRYTAASLHDLVGPLSALSIETERIKKFIQGARRQAEEQDTQDFFFVQDEIEQAIQILGSKARREKVEIRFDAQEAQGQGLHVATPNSLRLFGNAAKFSQLVTNLVSNAIDAYKGQKGIEGHGKQVLLRVSKVDDVVILTVQDWGMGIPKENAGKIFDPFFTTKSPDTGHGIGLSICRDVVEEDFGGRIRMESKEGEGCTFVVEFPMAESGKEQEIG